MTYGDKIMKIASRRQGGAWAERICTELCYLDGISKAEGDRYNDLIEKAMDFVLEAPITEERVLAAEEMLAELVPVAKSYTELFIAHAHIDMNWQWGFQETAVISIDTFRTMLDLMREFPDFTFSQSQASVYKIVEETSPDMLEEIRQRVYEGRWEITASHWVEADKNLPDGESLTRQVLYTKQYLSKLFDLDPDYFCIDFEPDTFGHSAFVPEILADAGVKYYFHFRGRDEGKYLYNFVAPSGKSVLVWRNFSGYSNTVNERAVLIVPEFCAMHGVKVCPFLYGVGDHGGGPTRSDIRQIQKYQSWPLGPTIRFGTYHEFFEAIEPYRDQFEVLDHELAEFLTGCYTSQAHIKMANRISEARLNEAEMLSAGATVLAGADNRAKILGRAWEDVLFNQFHDILPGTGNAMTRDHAMGKFQDILARVYPTSNYAMRKIADAIDTSSIPFDDEYASRSEGSGIGWYAAHPSLYRQPAPERGRGSYRVIHFFNTTQYDRDELVEFLIWDYNVDIYQAEVVTPEGEKLEHIITFARGGYWGHGFSALAVKVKIPALGYATVVVRPPEKPMIDPTRTLRLGEDGHLMNPSWVDMYNDRHINDKAYELANDKIYARFDPMTLELVSLIDKETGEEMLDSPAAYFAMYTENSRFGMTSWRTGPRMNEENLNKTCNTHVYEYTRSGATDHPELTGYKPGIVNVVDGLAGTGLRERLCYDVRFRSSGMKVEIELKPGSKVLEFKLSVDWNECGQGGYLVPALAFVVPHGYETDTYTYDIPFGLIDRPAREQDVPASTFLFAPSGKAVSLGIVTDTKHGFRGHNNTATVSLLRATTDPDPRPDQGNHNIRLGIVCATDALEMKKQSDLFVHPVCYASGTSHAGTLPFAQSALRVDGDGIKLSVVKGAEDGNGIIVRFYNLTGEKKNAQITLPASVIHAELADSTERTLAPLTAENGLLTIPTEPYAAVTVRLF